MALPCLSEALLSDEVVPGLKTAVHDLCSEHRGMDTEVF